MEFVYEQALQEYMVQKGKKNIVVEVAQSSHSDFDVQELHVHFVNEKQAEFLKSKKRFHAKSTFMGEVLLPPYRLEYDDTVVFGLKSFLCFKMITHRGIRF